MLTRPLAQHVVSVVTTHVPAIRTGNGPASEFGAFTGRKASYGAVAFTVVQGRLIVTTKSRRCFTLAGRSGTSLAPARAGRSFLNAHETGSEQGVRVALCARQTLAEDKPERIWPPSEPDRKHDASRARQERGVQTRQINRELNTAQRRCRATGHGPCNRRSRGDQHDEET